MGSAQYSVKNEPSERTIHVRMAGFFEESEMKDFIRLYLEATTSYGGKPHVVLADLRELQISSLDVSKLLGDAIGQARKQGVTCCAHLTSATVVKMQMARLAREHSHGEDVTVNVSSLEEANKVLAEARLWMGLETPGAPAPEGAVSVQGGPKTP
jgi:hypothetical protein